MTLTVGHKPLATRSDHAFAALSNVSAPARLLTAFVLLMPFVGGLPRGSILPMVRASELLQVGLTGGAVVLVLLAYGAGGRWLFRPLVPDWWMLGLAVAGSVVPIVSLAARAEPIGINSVVEALAMMKYAMLWLFARLAIRSTHDVAAVLHAAILAATTVALLAVLEGLGIGPSGSITRALVTTGSAGSGEGRAFTLLGSAISTGAVIILGAAIAAGYAAKTRRLGYFAVLGLMFLGAVATGQATSPLALAIVLAVTAVHHRVVVRSLVVGIPAAVVACLLALPILQSRAADFASGSVVPQSWLVRWVNVSELYWPSIADGGWILGVRPGTTQLPPDTWRTEVFLESGYLWTLWVGGVPLLVAFVGMLWSAWRALKPQLQDTTLSVAAVAARSAVAFMVVFNMIDPHLSLRGSADFTYVLIPIALAYSPLAAPDTRRRDILDLVHIRDPQVQIADTRIQIGEIGGALLAPQGWARVAPGNGVDRGVDVAVRSLDGTTASARMFFERTGADLRGIMLHPIQSSSPSSEALAWRAIALCASSMRLVSVDVPANSSGVARLEHGELRDLAAEARRLERTRARLDGADPEALRADPEALRAGPAGRACDGVRVVPHEGLGRTRRLLDICISASALAVLAPLMTTVAVLVRRSSPGTAFFRQMRIGAGGLPFEVLKFRSMDNSAGQDVHRTSIEESLRNGEPDQKVEHDPRITRIGAFLRRTSLDELPQLINVVRGEMTLVGPRPSLLWETSMFAPHARRRLQLTPGIAGLWQASGRGDLSTEEMLELDLQYADQVSLRNDIRLFARTVLAVFRREGAR